MRLASTFRAKKKTFSDLLNLARKLPIYSVIGI